VSRNEFHGPNEAYVWQLYEQYLTDPDSVSEQLRKFFKNWAPPAGSRASHAGIETDKIIAASSLAYSIRTFGNMSAQLDPLGLPPPGDPSLTLEFHNLIPDDLHRIPADVVGGPLAKQYDNAWEAINALRQIYCGRISYGYSHIRIPEEREWLRESAEIGRFRPPLAPIDGQALLDRLTEVEVFEQFFHRTFPGKTRFSIEGLDILIPMLDEIISMAISSGVCAMLIGMAHRGRMNVLAHILNKPYGQILAEFKDPLRRDTAWEAQGWTGDVVYHEGGSRPVLGGKEVKMVVAMPANPSHLEYIDPVLEGMARAADAKVDQPGAPVLFPDAAIPVQMHGDASFMGEGVVLETMNMAALPGYTTGGTVHIITNNQLGFTTPAHELHSSLYASDLAKGLRVPVIYTNADDPEACIEAARTATAYRERFHKDFLIDLIGYRRYGHNEGDEPGFTQPQMYQIIKDHPSVRALWSQTLMERGELASGRPEELVRYKMSNLQEIYQSLRSDDRVQKATAPGKSQSKNHHKWATPTLMDLRELNAALLVFPKDFEIHPRLKRAMERRTKILDDAAQPTVDWAAAEQLAFGTILAEGVPIRLTGEDVRRGTFSQRHAVLYDYQTGKPHTPLQSIPQVQASFEIHNSPLTENAAVGYEFGYNIQAPDRLVIWEAQYGDFINVAQTMIDEFVVSARDKWGQKPTLVLLLPHGNEGQGPDHSSARIERFLQLAAENNLRIVYPTTAAQYYHLLRLQAASLNTDPLPLIVFTPKGLLRHPRVASKPTELVESNWQPVLDDPQWNKTAAKVQHIVLCSGRIFVDLADAAEKEVADIPTAVIRLEQLYPFPHDELQAILSRYTQAESVTWVQEEPQNMGAWSYLHPLLTDLVGGRMPVFYAGRPPSSSPAEGSSSWYAANQKGIIDRAFNQKAVEKENRVILERG
jgi:2-oxoglutarate dehydrogenase E1 component